MKKLRFRFTKNEAEQKQNTKKKLQIEENCFWLTIENANVIHSARKLKHAGINTQLHTQHEEETVNGKGRSCEDESHFANV